ncbi:MAG: sigma 54-interacting transcriptional regulator [Clostridiales Family XIII bacterium]|nr:sigma 54-interacting transcriptional regulator [Clostridia bacterium]MDY3010688.1 sigma 54-interacting transcriptional regulator [Clostridiales Family XIII bacterium]
MIQLVDKNACVLKTIYDDELIGKLAHNISVHAEGYLVSEAAIGTNSSALALSLQKPMQVIGTEHFQSRNQIFACSSAPLFDDERNLLGCISIMSPLETYKYNLLGTVCTIADAIEKELKMKKALDSLNATNLMLNTCIETLSKGILFLDTDQNILFHNQLLLNILQLTDHEIKGKNFYDLIDIKSFPVELHGLNKNTTNTEITLTNKSGKQLDIVLDISAIYNNNALTSTLVSFDTQTRSHSLTSKLLNTRALYTFDSLIGASSELQNIKAFGLSAAHSMSNVLILGESGTGKELLAQAIHNASPRARKSFVAVNCGSIPKNLIASELFGYEYGAFSGASKSGSPGKFELANGGTIFLDEIGDMPFELQISLLRVLQEKEVTRLGGKQAKKLDVRIIAATNKNLVHSITTNQFRSDLYYRLNVLNITVPPLRNRTADIMPLTNYFMKRYSKSLGKNISNITDEARDLLLSYSWPGNIRELENTIERAINVAAGNIITKADLSILGEITHTVPTDVFNPANNPLSGTSNFMNSPSSATSEPAESAPAMSPEIKEYKELIELFTREKGHTKTVAKILNIPLSTLYGKLRKYQINPKEYKTWK